MARQPQEAAPDSVSFNKFSGLKNTVTRERLAPSELEVALNIDIDDAGQIRRRRGYTRVSTGNFHSLHRTTNHTLIGVKDGTLGIINPNYSFVSLAFSAGAAPLAFVQVGDIVYFSSEDVSGKFNQLTKTVTPWGTDGAGTWLSPVVNPIANQLPPLKGKMLGKPPLATALAYYNGRIYMAHGSTLWATELYLYDYVDKTKTYTMYESDITVLGAVTDGIYVGTKDAIWFQTGAFNEMRRQAVNQGGVYPGSLVTVLPNLLPDQLTGNTRSAVMMLTEHGLCVGLDSGVLVNMTQNTVLFPEAIRVNSLFRMQDGVNQYVGVPDSAGSPSSNARIGDYVDAEIRRFQGA